jgi:hypothetical protein
MATINILVIVDGTGLASAVADGIIPAGTQASPTALGSYESSDVYISMVAPNGSVVNNTQGQQGLLISTNGGDIIAWGITTFANNFYQTAYLYNGIFNPSNSINTPLSYACGEASVYLALKNQHANKPTKFINQASTVSGTILQVDVTIQYVLSFTLVNNSNGAIIGYFCWDPFITVN